MSNPPKDQPLDLTAHDKAGRIREAAFGLLLIEQRPIGSAEIAHLTRIALGDIESSLADLSAHGWIDVDGGDVVGSAGLSLSTGPHRLTIAGWTFRTWCAYDAIGIAAAVGDDALVETDCPVCGEGLALDMKSDPSLGERPERLWLAAGGTDLRGDFCAPTVLLCSAVHGLQWSDTQGGRGRIVDLNEASKLGAAAWASCAAAVRAISRDSVEASHHGGQE